jgi:hypothetical protein
MVNDVIIVGLSLVRLFRASKVNLKLTSLTTMFLPLTKNHGDSVAFRLAVRIIPGFLPLTRAFLQTLSFEPVLPFSLSSPPLFVKLIFDIYLK